MDKIKLNNGTVLHDKGKNTLGQDQYKSNGGLLVLVDRPENGNHVSISKNGKKASDEEIAAVAAYFIKGDFETFSLPGSPVVHLLGEVYSSRTMN